MKTPQRPNTLTQRDSVLIMNGVISDEFESEIQKES